MMDPRLLANVALNAGSVALFLAAVEYLLLPVIKAEFRHDLFALRRDLFELVATEKISRNDVAYLRMRGTLNALLARAEDLTGIQVVVVTLMLRGRSTVSAHVVEAEIAAVPNAAARERLRHIRTATSQATGRHILHLAPISPALWVFLGISFFRRGVASFTAPFVRGLEAEAVGMMKEPLAQAA